MRNQTESGVNTQGGQRRWSVCSLVLLAIVFALAGAGCGEGDSSGLVGGEEVELELLPEPNRVISMAPALTHMIQQLGKGHLIVGVGANDVVADPDTPIVGTYLDPDVEKILRLRPSHILMMVGKEGVPANLQAVCQKNGIELIAYPYPRTINDIGKILFDEAAFYGLPTVDEELYDDVELPVTPADPSLEGSASGTTPAKSGNPDAGGTKTDDPTQYVEPGTVYSLGELLLAIDKATYIKIDLLRRLGAMQQVADREPAPRVLLVIGTGPVMVSGPKTVLDELLLYAGGLNSAADASVSAPTYDREKLLELQPEVILFFQPDGPVLGSIDEDARLAEFRGLDIPAVKNNRIHLINHRLALLPSVSVLQVTGRIAKLLHPKLAGPIDAVLLATSPEEVLADIPPEHLREESLIETIEPEQTPSAPVEPPTEVEAPTPAPVPDAQGEGDKPASDEPVQPTDPAPAPRSSAADEISTEELLRQVDELLAEPLVKPESTAVPAETK